ncbi:hypothetical protein PF008_g25255 [Phytophthora fragariae]|uniref:Uncharacterized protein n=1 Tax=Phytophthora fragariae TaxID=53985 RepID=A0A6G0QKI4_9STRA|nr:hypothetical protein PF008_g25255 [Phytophthora fragariae]
MGTLSKTAQSAAPVPGTPSSAPKGLEKRKLGTAAKIRERKRRRAAARKENQGAGAKSSVEAATTATGGCEAAGPGWRRLGGGKVKKRKKAAGGLLAEALQAAMAEAAAEASEAAPTGSSVVPCGSRSGAGARPLAIIPRDRSDMGSTSRATDQVAAQILTELASRALDGGVHHPALVPPNWMLPPNVKIQSSNWVLLTPMNRQMVTCITRYTASTTTASK